MADAWAWVYEGRVAGCFLDKPSADFCTDRSGGRAAGLRIETASVRHAEELHQVLKDLTGLARLASCPLNTFQAAIRNSDELLQLIERESTEDPSHEEQADRPE